MCVVSTRFINVGWLTAYIQYISDGNNELKIYAKFNSRMFLLILKVILYVQFKENGSVMRFFDIFFLHESNQPRSVINRLKWFCWKIRFCRDIQMLSLKILTSAVLVCPFVNISAKKNLSANYFSIFLSRAQVGWIHREKKGQNILWHCHFKIIVWHKCPPHFEYQLV